MFRHALRLMGGRSDAAQDVAQEAWTRAIRGLPAFEGRSSLGTWLRMIVARCALERIRADERIGAAPPDDAEVPEPPNDAAASVDLERAFEALPTGFRTVLVLHDVEGYTHEEIGALLGVAEGTSKSQLSRARKWLRRALGAGYRNGDPT